jgi:hypothetical protein
MLRCAPWFCHEGIGPFAAALVAGGSAVLGGLLSGVYPDMRAYWTRPRLVIDYEGGRSNLVHSEYKEHQSQGVETTVSEIYIRARVRNTGRQIAKACRVFLVDLKEVQPSGLTGTSLNDAKVLAWAGFHFASLDIPRGVNFFVDIARVSKHNPGWKLSVEKLFANQKTLEKYCGTYRFYLLVTSDNASPSRCEIDITYNNDWNNLRALAAKS